MKRVRPPRHIPNYIRDPIEQMLAMGRSDEYITARGFTLAQIGLVEAAMDEANRNETVPAAPGAYGRSRE